MADDSVVYTVDELAAYWRVSKATVYTMIRNGKLQAFSCGSSLRITDRAVRAFENGTEETA